MMTEPLDPWKPIEPPDQSSNVNGRRVDPDLKWDIFWAVDADRNCLLIFQHKRTNNPIHKLPNLRGLKVELRTPETGSDANLVITLIDREQREIFHRLCIDIISATKLANSENEAIECFLARTWRWHRLLVGGRDGRLSDDEQKGLFGELGILCRVLFPTIGVKASVNSWTGPLGSPKDFEIGRVCIEAKARRGAATPFVTISSEFQLDTNGVDKLFLQVSEITSATGEDRKAITITNVARSIREEIEKQDLSVVELFEERLTSVGFDWADDYSDKLWLIGPDHLFEVNPDFPRVTPSMFPSGVGSLRYSISLPDCEPFRTDQDYLKKQISGALHGDKC